MDNSIVFLDSPVQAIFIGLLEHGIELIELLIDKCGRPREKGFRQLFDFVPRVILEIILRKSLGSIGLMNEYANGCAAKRLVNSVFEFERDFAAALNMPHQRFIYG